jgi:hypothetical protein
VRNELRGPVGSGKVAGTAPDSPGEEKRRVAELEVQNGFRQFDLALEIIKTFLDPERPFALRPSIVQELQQIAVDGIERYPGQWRTVPAGI